jgi:8-oxo-dGTP pyrophosphatase MutT (NUDIX family)
MASSPPDVMRRALSHRVRRGLADPSLTPAAVFLLLYFKNGEYCVLLNKRSQHVEYHKGEISFPGGARDPGDVDFVDTALRETEEEMGISRADVTVLGELDEVKTGSRFRVRVFVGTIPNAYLFKPSGVEIAEVLEVPVASLRDTASLRVETRWEEGAPVTSYAYSYNNHLIFGVTARILQQFLELLEEGPKRKEH